MIDRIRHLFTHDLGRKLLALLFAVVLFDVLDAKVQATDRMTVHVVYVDETELGEVPEAADRTSKLVVAERAPHELPLVVADRPRPDVITLKLHATRDAIDRAKSRRRTFVLRLDKEGSVTPGVGDLAGVAELLEELGPGARVEIDPPITFRVEAEEERALVLGLEDLTLRGSPAPGFDRHSRSTVIRPSEVVIVGPRQSIQEAFERRAQLFDPVVLDGTSRQVSQEVSLALQWRDRLRLLDSKREPLASIRVSLEFERKMAPVPAPEGLFELPVHVVCNDDLLRRGDLRKSWRDGWRLRFDAAVEGELKLALQFQAPESAVTGPTLDRVKLNLARDQVELVVRAHEAAGLERTTLKVTIVKFADFPDDLDVGLAPGTPAEVAVTWDEPAPAGASGSTEKSGDGGN